MALELPETTARLKRRVTKGLDDLLEKKLVAYAAAAGAAGVAVLACSQESRAQVVFTPTWISIVPRSQVSLDLDNDGIADFKFNVAESCHPSTFTSCSTLRVKPQNGTNQVWGSRGYAAALSSGVKLGSKGPFQGSNTFMANEVFHYRSVYSPRYNSLGPWRQITRKYLGLKFVISGQVHYGWARLNVTNTNYGMYAAVTGYAYQSQPNTPISTGQQHVQKKRAPRAEAKSSFQGQSGSLGRLAAGAVDAEPESGNDQRGPK